MARVTATYLEEKILTLKNQLENKNLEPHKIAIKTQERNYLVAKLTQMDEHDLLTIEIN